MKVAQLVDVVSSSGGGVFELAWGVAQAAACGRLASHLYGIADGAFPTEDPGQVTVHAARPIGPRALYFAPSLLPRLMRGQVDLLHAHGLWTPQALVTRLWSARTRRPYVVSVHGMLDPWALHRSRVRKRLVAALYERGRLRGAACVHALGPFETAALRAFGVAGAVCEIPGAVELPPEASSGPPPWPAPLEAGRPVLLYLGRLHPKKGLLLLLAGFARARQRAPESAAAWRLAIAGWGEEGQAATLARLAAELGIGADVILIGPLRGAARGAVYRASQAYVLPSLSEGLPLTVLEAWAERLPVLMTDACNLPCGFEAAAAVRMGPGADGVAAALLELFSMSDADRQAMGRRGRALVERRFSWPVVGPQFVEVYSWLAGGGARPASVRGA